MNFQQLEYIIAIDKYRHFNTAAEKCFVTQPTLSMMIQKLEEELGVKIFDRSQHPIAPTEIGAKIILQAQNILTQANYLKELVTEEKGILSGKIRLGIIPTLAPYLLPLFLTDFVKKHPEIQLFVSEYNTEDITAMLQKGALDIGILATPLQLESITEYPLFYEPFYLYTSEKLAIKKKYVLPKDVDINKLWLLEEGHCLRTQVYNFCEFKKKSPESSSLHYEAGSIETLKKLVDSNQGVTIIPELATLDFKKEQRARLKPFKKPVPNREISLVTHKDFVKSTLAKAFRDIIINNVPKHMLNLNEEKQVIDIN